jgi:hypothetical protein
VLYDPERGILATYSTHAEIADGLLRGCFDGSAGLRLWAGQSGLPFVDAAHLFNWELDDNLYLPLEQATGLTLEEFNNEVQEHSSLPCVETPANLWPDF